MALDPRPPRPLPAAHALVSVPGAPRRLPGGEPLPPEDYRRLFGVIEAVDREPDLPAFRERLLRALEEWFGYSTIAVLHGPTIAAALYDGRGVKSGYSREFLAAYAERWITADPYMASHAHQLLAERGVVTLRELHPELVPAQHAFVERFLKPHGIHDKVALLIDAGAEGVMYVGVVVRGAQRIATRDVAVMRSLRRHLAPLVTRLLADDRAVASAAGDLGLTPREREVAGLAARGLTNQQIAQRLFVGVGTVKKHLTRALAKTGATSRTQLAVRWRAFETAQSEA
ncbi:helix-turn-helix transcriptional regulator [Streptomyces sp. NBC_01803]|uniref:helix-turn-helix transcriptional regulator n=1 Tax=Streptomyces sp. NBC_01803 TaxID=2975946 RepID=UPI002DDAC579|nr:LuxR C-terminal-related transcriptional regulator [Streptomyces sp. NBC_01803]WSA46339.1 LuxR C-terminal-related transcriptional regulator [Streptomyces sp. NBC_01803]